MNNMNYKVRGIAGINSPTEHVGSQRFTDKDRLRYVYDNQAGTQILSQVPLTQFISSDASPPRPRGLISTNIAHIDHRTNLMRMSCADINS